MSHIDEPRAHACSESRWTDPAYVDSYFARRSNGTGYTWCQRIMRTKDKRSKYAAARVRRRRLRGTRRRRTVETTRRGVVAKVADASRFNDQGSVRVDARCLRRCLFPSV